jgi:hypothetical protein
LASVVVFIVGIATNFTLNPSSGEENSLGSLRVPQPVERTSNKTQDTFLMDLSFAARGWFDAGLEAECQSASFPSQFSLEVLPAGRYDSPG